MIKYSLIFRSFRPNFPDLMPMFEILYHDDALVAITKPAGYFVHRSMLDPRNKQIILQKLRQQIGQYLYPVHRLDRPTSGVLIFALNEESVRHIAHQFTHNTPTKIYHAVVRGFVGSEIKKMDQPLKHELEDPDAEEPIVYQESLTYCRGLAQCELPLPVGRYDTSRYSLVELQPITGRTHQLRRHLNYAAHPIVGDSKHGDLRHNKSIQTHFHNERLMLHASYLTLNHPETNQPLTLHSPFPEEFRALLTAMNLPSDNPPLIPPHSR